MSKYLIDANLPFYFSLWNNSDYIHMKDIDDSWSDDKIWDYAIENNLIIITKDSDFSNKVLLKGAPPKVIHLRFGNVKIKDFHGVTGQMSMDENRNAVKSAVVVQVEGENYKFITSVNP